MMVQHFASFLVALTFAAQKSKACYYLQMSWQAACAFVSPIMILQVFKMIMVALQPLEGSDSKAHKEVQVLIEDNLRLC
jgi:hypothetical protein